MPIRRVSRETESLLGCWDRRRHAWMCCPAAWRQRQSAASSRECCACRILAFRSLPSSAARCSQLPPSASLASILKEYFGHAVL